MPVAFQKENEFLLKINNFFKTWESVYLTISTLNLMHFGFSGSKMHLGAQKHTSECKLFI